MPNRLSEKEKEEELYLRKGARIVADRTLRAHADGPRRPGPLADSAAGESQRNRELTELQDAILGTNPDERVPEVDPDVLRDVGRGKDALNAMRHEPLARIGFGEINRFLTSRNLRLLDLPAPPAGPLFAPPAPPPPMPAPVPPAQSGGGRRRRATRKRKSRRGRKRARLNKRRARKTRGVSKARRTRPRTRRSRRP